MTRRRIQIKKVDNTTARQVTFSKRRRGLFKKAFELSTLCDAEIGLMVFSAAGKLFEYASSRFQSLSHTSFYFLFFLLEKNPLSLSIPWSFCSCIHYDSMISKGVCEREWETQLLKIKILYWTNQISDLKNITM